MYVCGDIFLPWQGQLQFPESCVRFAVTGSFVNSRIQVNHRRLELVWVALNVLLLSISHGELGVGTSGAAPGLTACMSSVLTLQRLFATMPLMDRGES